MEPFPSRSIDYWNPFFICFPSFLFTIYRLKIQDLCGRVVEVVFSFIMDDPMIDVDSLTPPSDRNYDNNDYNNDNNNDEFDTYRPLTFPPTVPLF